MNARTQSDNPTPAHSVTPLLRTVVLADLVDSTAFIQRLGDTRTAMLMQRLDLQIRDLLEFTGGRLIDKADGLLALFERPVQAVDFALRYQQQLRQLGTDEHLGLSARVGIHVGELMTWTNSPQAIAAGAKPLEVEGLAKPVAARLMSLALPGQILLSGMAQTLAHRAQSELGERASRLRWLVHGRYRFKGVPAPMLVHEVGESGFSPLRQPPSGQKVWREVPLWRKPPILAAELLLVLAVGGFSLYSALRSPPVLAFNERDWVVLGDLQNYTGEPAFNNALDAAFRVGLEQSRYVNLVSNLQEKNALERMQRSGQSVDRQLGAELALREGAKALILPTVTEVGGKVRFSAEVIDPHTGVTVYSESADRPGRNGAVPAVDAVLGKLRTRLGESLDSIGKSSKPLEQVTTNNIDALRAYSLGLEATAQSRVGDAQALHEQAARLDPDFALAYIALGGIRYSANDNPGANRYFDLAESKRARLSHREALLLDAVRALHESPDRMLSKWKLLATIYPDEYRAYYNYAYFAHNLAQRYQEALDLALPATAPQNPRRMSTYYQLGVMNQALDKPEAALEAFKMADTLGVSGTKREYAEVYAQQRRYDLAQRILDSQTTTQLASADIETRLSEVSFPLDRGLWEQALQAAVRIEPEAAKASPLAGWTYRGIHLSLRSYAPDPALRADLHKYFSQQRALLPGADSLDRREILFEILATGWMAAHTGDTALGRQALSVARGPAIASESPALTDMNAILESELDLAAKQPARAIERLQPLVDQGRELYFTHAVLMRAYAATRAYPQALREADWLAAHRGRAYGEFNSLNMWQPVNVAESNLALLAASVYAGKANKPDIAKKRKAAFEAAWPGSGKLAVVSRRSQVLAQ